MEDLKPSPPNSCPLTPIGFLDRAATVYGDCTSVIYNSTSYTWSQTHRRCLQLASSISSLGIGFGHVVSVLAPNIPAMCELHFSVPMAGAILNTINTRLDARTIFTILHHSESKLLFVDIGFRSVALEAISLFPPGVKPPPLVLITEDQIPGISATEEPPFSDRNRLFGTYEEMVGKGNAGFTWIRPKSEWDPLVLNYTSGTTSAPKGVVHCHRGAFINVVNSLIDWSVPKQAVYLWTLPMFHSNGWTFPWGMAAVGGTNVCIRKFDGSTIFEMIQRHGVTHMCAAPVVLNMISSSPNACSLKNPVHLLTGGAPPPASILLKIESLGFSVAHGYGLTETGGITVICAWKEKWNRFPASEQARLKSRQGVKTIGMAEVDVVDPESGTSVKRDGSTLGEIVMRGGCVMLGYFKDPQSTRNCMRDGWFFTGDVGVMHSDGYLEIKDRSKDVIISGGENLSSVEVETVLYSNPAVYEAAVVARPDEFWGESPCAFVSLKSDLNKKPSEKEIIEYCKARLPHFMVPKTVVIRDELPKTSTGKIQKFALREIAKDLGSTRGVPSRM